MKIKTSVTLDSELLHRIDSVLLETESRSAFFLDAAQQLTQKRELAKRNADDLKILNAQATTLNEEALDNLAFIADVFNEQGLDQL
jgi:metal-responsive CopG/Arc/MetJ family transcriptional regulator